MGYLWKWPLSVSVWWPKVAISTHSGHFGSHEFVPPSLKVPSFPFAYTDILVSSEQRQFGRQNLPSLADLAPYHLRFQPHLIGQFFNNGNFRPNLPTFVPPPPPPIFNPNHMGSAEISLGTLNPDTVPPGGMIEGIWLALRKSALFQRLTHRHAPKTDQNYRKPIGSVGWCRNSETGNLGQRALKLY